MISVKFTGIKGLEASLRGAPSALVQQVERALMLSVEMAGSESQDRTPVATGNLKSSIGGTGGYKFIRGLTAGIGTNVNYAIYVHEGYGKHVVGERKFMERGAEAAKSYIVKTMNKALSNVAKKITM